MATALPTAGYSGKSLPDKLGFKPGMAVAFIALPETLAGLAEVVAFAGVTRLDGWKAVTGKERFDAIHAFTASHAEIAGHLARLQRALKRGGLIWVSWPKKAAKVPTDVTEDVVRAEALRLDLVDVKVAAVDAVWSGLKLVIRKERR
ncbi:MAG: DUF3052 family protein [Bauldia sp.]|nr:MAG: DUF3052 family protein [Bauldia sp.]MBZ0228479.1 DUF3052 domain-containing protein [Bauldia sp.]